MGGLPREGGPKVQYVLKTQENQTFICFGLDIPGFWRNISAVPENFEKKIVFKIWPL